MDREERLLQSRPVDGAMPSADLRLLEQLRGGDLDAGHRFIQEYYPGLYRYLLYLTGSPDAAEDLTQETFLQAWRRLDTYEARSALATWLHRIAHREFLQALRSRRRGAPPAGGTTPERMMISLEEVGELPEVHAPPLTETVELRAIISKLPVEQRDMVILHYLEGHEYEEIARILAIPVGRVKHRLSEARARLQQELGEGDLLYLNEPAIPMRPWAWLPLDRMYALAMRLSLGDAGDREAPGPGATREETVERREFLRQAAVGAAGLMLPETEREIVDHRLTQKVTCAFKSTALSDVCEHLRAQIAVHLAAGPSVADEKVTLFCEKRPLREVMRQMSRPFGYTWVRTRRESEYRYELVQDLRSQLLEEELRSRDRNAALLALDREIERYRPYLSLSPDEALTRARNAPPEEKKLLGQLAGVGWGPIQMYFRLSPQELAALRARQRLQFSEVPRAGEQPLPPDVGRGALQTMRDFRFFIQGGRSEVADAKRAPQGLPLTVVPEARGTVYLTMRQSELGQFTLDGGSGFAIWSNGQIPNSGSVSIDHYAVGVSPAARSPQNEVLNAKLARDPAFRRPITVRPQSSCPSNLSPRSGRPSPPRGGAGGEVAAAKVTTADVLEALHRATGMPIVADYYTRLYEPGAVLAVDQPLFEAVNRLADAMRLRWKKDGDWMEFRSATFYDDRLKEVPNRLLNRWAAARQAHGALTLDDLAEIAQLPDAQLDAAEMAEGARDCFGLAEWDLVRSSNLRPHLRFLAELTAEQRREAASAAGLLFRKMSLAQQQRYIDLGVGDLVNRITSLAELAGATLRVDYTQPGWFQWKAPEEPGGPPRPEIGPWPVRERTSAAALLVARRLDPHVDVEQLVPTRLDLKFIYIWNDAARRNLRVIDPGGGSCIAPW